MKRLVPFFLTALLLSACITIVQEDGSGNGGSSPGAGGTGSMEFRVPQPAYNAGGRMTVEVHADTGASTARGGAAVIRVDAETLSIIGGPKSVTAAPGSPFDLFPEPYMESENTLAIPFMAPGFADTLYTGPIAVFDVAVETNYNRTELNFVAPTAFAPPRATNLRNKVLTAR